MENSMERLKYSLIYANSAIYVDKAEYLDKLFEKETVNLAGNCTDEELMGTASKVPSWYLGLVARASEAVSILKIDFDDCTIDEQKRFLSIIKDRTIVACTLPKNCKVLVISSDRSKIDNELIGYMVVV